MRARIIRAFATLAPGKAAALPSWLDSRPSPLAPVRFADAAVLLALVDRPDGMTVLLTRRCDRLVNHAGQIAFPGGRVEPDDPSPEAAALREAEEEIGLAPRHVTVLGRLATRETGTGFRVVPVVGLIAPPFALAPDPEEVASVFEVPLAYIFDPANRRIESRIQRGAEHRFYVIEYGEHYIWGLTARLLVNFAEVVDG